jgi:Ca2+-dependent lipid-binding protein
MDQSEDGQKLEMWLSARNLINTDFIGKSDPRCQVSIRRWNENWQILGTTETIKEDLNPDWKTVFKFDYQFCQHQILAFEIVDVDDRTGDPDDPLGKTYVSVGDLITMKSSK